MTTIDDKYQSLGGEPGMLGRPTGVETATPNGRGSFRHYQHGSIYWSAGTGAHEVHGLIRDKWAAHGWEQGHLGFPLNDESEAVGGRFNHFEGGSIYWAPATGAHEVHGAIRARWQRTGWERGPLGLPVTDESEAINGGRFNHFQHGSIYWTPTTGAHEVHGAIHAHWRNDGFERGGLGYPTTDETPTTDGSGRWSRFQGGQIYWTPARGARTESAPASRRRPWAILLCKHADIPAEPNTLDYFRNLFTEQGVGTEGLYDYWRDVTYGTVDLEGSAVYGWYTLPHTNGTDVQWRDTLPAPVSRARRIDAGIQAAAAEVDFTQYDGICVILNGVVDTGSLGRQPRTLNGRTKSYGLVVIDPNGWNATVAAHEFGHGYSLSDSFSNTVPPTRYGDRWDIMSAVGNVFHFPGSRYGISGPSLNAANRLFLGCMAADRVLVAGTPGTTDVWITLTELDSPHVPGPLVMKIPVLPGDPTRFFTVEVRSNQGWDRQIPRGTILIHDVQGGIPQLVQNGGGPEFGPGETFVDPTSRIRVAVSGNAAAVGTAVVRVTI